MQRYFNGLSTPASDEFYPTPVPGYYSKSAFHLEITPTAVDTVNNEMTIPTFQYTVLSKLKGDSSSPHGVYLVTELVSGTITGGLTDGQAYYIRFEGITIALSEDKTVREIFDITEDIKTVFVNFCKEKEIKKEYVDCCLEYL